MRLTVVALLVLVGMSVNAASRLVARFKQMDKDGDGKLSPSELGSRIWDRLKSYDADGDTRLSLPEMKSSGAGGEKGDKWPGGANNSFAVRSFEASSGHSLAYSCFAPRKVREKIPLIV